MSRWARDIQIRKLVEAPHRNYSVEDFRVYLAFTKTRSAAGSNRD